MCEEVQGYDVLTQFHGMDLTREKLCSMIKKWHTIIDAHVEAKTTDGYSLRLVGRMNEHNTRISRGWMDGWQRRVGGGLALSCSPFCPLNAQFYSILIPPTSPAPPNTQQ